MIIKSFIKLTPFLTIFYDYKVIYNVIKLTLFWTIFYAIALMFFKLTVIQGYDCYKNSLIL